MVCKMAAILSSGRWVKSHQALECHPIYYTPPLCCPCISTVNSSLCKVGIIQNHHSESHGHPYFIAGISRIHSMLFFQWSPDYITFLQLFCSCCNTETNIILHEVGIIFIQNNDFLLIVSVVSALGQLHLVWSWHHSWCHRGVPEWRLTRCPCGSPMDWCPTSEETARGGAGRGECHDVIKWKHFPRYRPFVRGIHRSPVNSPHKGQWCRSLMFSLICAWINGWVNNGEAGDLWCQLAHYDVTIMMMQPFEPWEISL